MKNTTPVTLEVDSFEPREVLKVNYKFEQKVDLEGQVAGLPRGGRVTIRVKALNDGNNQMLQWLLEEGTPRNFKLVFVNTVDGASMKTLEGTNCYCVHFKECWEDKQLHYEEVEVVCQDLKNGTVAFENPWK